MVLELAEWPALKSYLEDIKILKRSFNHSELIYIPRTLNTKADSFAHSARATIICSSYGRRDTSLVRRVFMTLFLC
ncbi:hypothetical protein Bca4012_026128 [Brassica carinata]